MKVLTPVLRSSLLTQRCQFNFGPPQVGGIKNGSFKISYLHYFTAGSLATRSNQIILGPANATLASVYNVVVSHNPLFSYLQDNTSKKYLKVSDNGNSLVETTK